MSRIVFFDGQERKTLLPLTYLRPVSLCRVGIRTIEEKWMEFIGLPSTHLTESYLRALYPYRPVEGEMICINGACLPGENLLAMLPDLDSRHVLAFEGSPMIFKCTADNLQSLDDVDRIMQERLLINVEAQVIRYPEDILNLAHQELLSDYKILSQKRSSSSFDTSMRIRGSEIFTGQNVLAYDAIINALDGPIYIDDDVEIMEGAVIKGPAYIGKGTKVHVGAKIYADTILGPECRIGGEVKRTTIFGYSNKAHDGYLGDSVIGHWCNLGADTNNSNMKNTYGFVSLWNIVQNEFRTTDRQFLGMILGDHTMSAINTSFNTGTVTGIFTNIIDRNPDRYLSSFTWAKDQKYRLDKAIEVAQKAFDRRSVKMESGYEQVIRYLADQL